MLTENIIEGAPLMECLLATRASLQDRPFKFHDWTQCTCGHIYRGAVGHKARDTMHVVHSSNATYLQVLAYVAEANGLHKRWSMNETGVCSACWSPWNHDLDLCSLCLAQSVSVATLDPEANEKDGRSRRGIALRMIDVAIEKCAAEQADAIQSVIDSILVETEKEPVEA